MIKRLFIFLTILAVCAALPSCVTQDKDTADVKAPYKNDAGWTVFTPSSDTRILYVSSEQGSDSTGEAYRASDPEIGQSPHQPSGPIKAFKTFAAAFKQTREGHPDWILLKRGDTFYTSVAVRNGRSESQPFLLGSYGNSPEMPLIKAGDKRALEICCESFNYIAVQGIDFYAHTRDFDSPDFVSTDGGSGFYAVVKKGHYGTGLLIEGCKFRFFAGNVIQAGGRIANVMVRRNLVLDSYSTESHSQGLFVSNVSMTLEENIFDHNGWYRQQTERLDNRTGGQATMFNHNTYFEDTHNVLFKNNIFLRPSSIGNKWTANSGEASTRDIEIANNLYIDGEIGISMGGNKEGPWRFKNIHIHDNVLLNLGNSMPTDRDFAWYLEIRDWDQGTINNNVLMHPGSTTTDNIFALKMEGTTRSVEISDNIIHGFGNGYMIGIEEKENLENVKVFNNTFYFENDGGYFVRAKNALQGISFYNNHYLNEYESNHPFSVEGKHLSSKDWQALSGDTGSEFSIKVDFTFNAEDDSETAELPGVRPAVVSITRATGKSDSREKTIIEAYQAVQGNPASMDNFIKQLRKQSYTHWDTDYTAQSINRWIRQHLTPPKSEPAL